MSFLYPQFLFGLAALSIPIIIHLFNFRKTKRIYYSSTQFLKQVKEASTSNLKLKHLLILLSRLLFIFFLVIAFAQPFIPATQKRGGNIDVHVYLDNSFSMSSLVGIDYKALDVGLTFADELSRIFPVGTRFTFLTNDFASFSNVFKTGVELSDLTTEIDLSGKSRSFNEIWSRLSTGLQKSAITGAEVFWISDFQKSTLGNPDLQSLDSLIRINIFPLEVESTANLFVDSIYLKNPFILGAEKIELTVVIKNTGLEDASDIPMKIFLNEVQTSNATFDVPASSKVEHQFDLGFDLQRLNLGRISIEDYPITFDNDFYFTIDAGDKIKVLEIKSSIEATPVENVYGNEDLFDFRSFRFTNIDYSQIALVDLVILNELEILDPSISTLLINYLAEGGSVVLIPALEPDIASYQGIIRSRNLQPVDSIFMQALTDPDLTNPFFENVFEESKGIISMPQTSQVIEWGQDRTAILSFRNGDPFLSQIRSSGNVYLFAGPLDDRNSGLQNHAVFVPVMYKIAFGSNRSESRLYYSVNQSIIEISIDSLEQNSIIKLVDGDKELIPIQRVFSGSVYLELPSETISPGFFIVEAGSKKITTLAFNLDRNESQLENYRQDEIEEIFSDQDNVAIFNVNDGQGFSSTLRKLYEGTPLWKYAVILALIFLFVEIAFVRLLKP